ncbi:hypothetical protein ACFC1T_09245 [Kitasatospora sp. NPDC056076]|uniref:hypothetical protein n=1 Tax=Kitasatospora sp. NPDC056076 TaxID=3345703 RepID=UPI0035DE57F4
MTTETNDTVPPWTLAPPPAADAAVLVFIANPGRSTGKVRGLWLMKRADAQRVCDDPRTAARGHMLCWSSPERQGAEGEDWTLVRDKGLYDDVLDALKVTPLRRRRHSR